MKHFICRLALFALALVPASAHAGLTISENFDDISTLSDDGWFITNNSAPLGTSSWFQGNPALFGSHQGEPSAYIAASAESVSGAVGAINNWLLTPNVWINDGDVFTFYTRTREASIFPDRLQLRLSTNGASTNVGSSTADVGDFTILLQDINEFYGTDYPESWTEFSVTIAGLGGRTSGRFAFRYFVEDAGTTGNSNYIGIDEVTLVAVPEPSSALVLLVGSCVLLRRRRA